MWRFEAFGRLVALLGVLVFGVGAGIGVSAIFSLGVGLSVMVLIFGGLIFAVGYAISES